MRSISSRHHERLSSPESVRSIGSSRADKAAASSNRRGVSTRSDIYARPDLYAWSTRAPATTWPDSSLGCLGASARAACWRWRAARAGHLHTVGGPTDS
jgi:hypothetical protein